MRKKLANQKQQQVDDEDDRIAKTVAERESKREVRFNISLSSFCFLQFFTILLANGQRVKLPHLLH